MGVRRQARAADLAPEVLEVGVVEAAFEIGPGVDAGRRMALDVDVVAGFAVVLAVPEVVEAHVVERSGTGEGGQVAANAVGPRVRMGHHGHGVPADEGPQALLDLLVAGEPGLVFRGDRVDVWRRDGGGEVDLHLTGLGHEPPDQETCAVLAPFLDDCRERLQPIVGLIGVDIGNLLMQPVKEHGF